MNIVDVSKIPPYVSREKYIKLLGAYNAAYGRIRELEQKLSSYESGMTRFIGCLGSSPSGSSSGSSPSSPLVAPASFFHFDESSNSSGYSSDHKEFNEGHEHHKQRDDDEYQLPKRPRKLLLDETQPQTYHIEDQEHHEQRKIVSVQTKEPRKILESQSVVEDNWHHEQNRVAKIMPIIAEGHKHHQQLKFFVQQLRKPVIVLGNQQQQKNIVEGNEHHELDQFEGEEYLDDNDENLSVSPQLYNTSNNTKDSEPNHDDSYEPELRRTKIMVSENFSNFWYGTKLEGREAEKELYYRRIDNLSDDELKILKLMSNCRTCFRFVNNLSQHCTKFHFEPIKTCSLCGFRYSKNPRSLPDHILLHHRKWPYEIPYFCVFCAHIVENEDGLKAHVNRFHPGSYEDIRACYYVPGDMY